MRIISCHVENFASYKSLEFNFQDHGLSLISGATGSGKSTLCDIIPWVLFGITSKNGTVNDVISWPGNETTRGTLTIEASNGNRYVIHRIRGKAKDNDLFYQEDSNDPSTRIRGKDLNDTQKLLNDLLGLTPDLYLAGAYFHEFSQTAQFFTATAKNRRILCEQLVDLSLAKNLQEKLKEQFNEHGKEIAKIDSQIGKNTSNIEMLNRLQVQEKTKASDWEKGHNDTKRYVANLYDKFEANRKRTIHKKCNACGTVLEHPKEIIDTSENPHLSRLAELEAEKNPHDGGVKDYSNEIETLEKANLREQSKYNDLSLIMDDILVLQDVVQDFRRISIKNTILGLETNTNKLLEKHFDAEIKVLFSAEDADKLEITIHKDGNVASFTQLSKGQRCLLKLCFGISVMQSVQNHHGVHFDQIFFDEALDGLDEVMKTKAYGLLQTLEQDYNSVFVVEHSEGLKTLFTNKLTVELENGSSNIVVT